MNYTFDWSVIYQYRHELYEGLVATLQLSALAAVLSLAGGILLALLAEFSGRLARNGVNAYTEFALNVPPIAVTFFLYFGFGASLFWSALLCVSVYATGQICQTVRSGIRTLPAVQLEAAVSSGLRPYQTLYVIVLPQVLFNVLQPLAGRVVNIVKNTSLTMTIGYMELTFQTRQIETLTFRGFESLTAGMLIYALIGSVILGSLSLLENRLSRRFRSHP